MEDIVIKERIIKTDAPEDYIVYTKIDSVLDSKPGELKFNVNESPAKLCWRLVHNGKEVLALFESDGITSTINNLVCGTEVEIEGEIKKLSLIESDLEMERMR